MSTPVADNLYEQVKVQIAKAICEADDFIQKSDPIFKPERQMRNRMLNARNVLNQIYANLSND